MSSSAAAARRSDRLAGRLRQCAAAQAAAGHMSAPCKRGRHAVAARSAAQTQSPCPGRHAPSIEPAVVEEAAAEELAAPEQLGCSRPTRELELHYYAQGCRRVAGIDEAGRGPLAGPVVAAACHIPAEVAGWAELAALIDDSKRMGAAQRRAAYDALTCHPAIQWATCAVDAQQIDRINILQATFEAMQGAAAQLAGGCADKLLVDGNLLPATWKQGGCAEAVVKGDGKCMAIAAASILAKVTRDRLMEGYSQQWPVYGFAQHKGYPTTAHVAAIRQHGACPIHRLTFNPLRAWKLTHATSQAAAGAAAASAPPLAEA